MPGHVLTATEHLKEKRSSIPHILTKITVLKSIEKIHIVRISLGSLLVQDSTLNYPEKTLSISVLGGYYVNKVQKDIVKF
ncbi:Alpha/beta hydrolase [Petrimonas sp. IBARAKI]|nr:Alpha/beta hydrolase [Petrimonas sp. IBARAKI]